MKKLFTTIVFVCSITLAFSQKNIDTFGGFQKSVDTVPINFPVGKVSNDTLYLENNSLGNLIFELWKYTSQEINNFLPQDQKPTYVALCQDGFIIRNVKAQIIATIRVKEKP